METFPGLGGAGDQDFDNAEIGPAHLGHELGAGAGCVEVNEVHGI